jgi:hypothetical protein
MNTKKHCLLCSDPARSRGLCAVHYTQFSRAKRLVKKELRDEFERLAIEQGKLLPLANAEQNAFTAIAMEVEKTAADQRKQDDATLKAAESKALYRRGKRPPESP